MTWPNNRVQATPAHALRAVPEPLVRRTRSGASSGCMNKWQIVCPVSAIVLIMNVGCGTVSARSLVGTIRPRS